METMREKNIQGFCRAEDAEGLDAVNGQFLTLAIQEVRQTVMEVVQVWLEGPGQDDQ
jgi:hypothetical protein